MTLAEKLTILTDAAKYDVACTSSGGDRRGGRLGKTITAGCCHSFSADGRCISPVSYTHLTLPTTDQV